LPLGKKFSKYFLKEYGEHRWPKLKKSTTGYDPKTWTAQMFKILDKVADQMKLEWKQHEMLRIDRAYYKGDSDCPILAVEHENGFRGIWNSEIPRLMAVNAELRVLICYAKERKQRYMLQKQMKGKLNAEMRFGRFNNEFLLIMGREGEVFAREKESFEIYWYYPGVYEETLWKKRKQK